MDHKAGAARRVAANFASSRSFLPACDLRRRAHRTCELDFAAPPPAYVLLGAGLGVEFPGRNHVVRASAVGTNLLNARYREYTSLLRYFADDPGWGLALRVSVDFDLSTARKG